ncbi:MAG: MFS transporter [Gammaproteobacteria bacterium]
MRSFLAKFTVLGSAVPELWVIFASKMLAILAYSVMNMTLVLWLSADLGYSDTEAGFLIAAWSSLMTLFTVLVGSFVDAVGLRRALLLGFAISMLSRAIMTSTTVAWLALPLGLMPLALGEALLTPVMVAAVKRFSTARQRSMAFSVFYTAMNVGFAGAGWIFDAVRAQLGEYGNYKLPLLEATLSTYRTLFLVSVVLSGIGLIAVFLSLRDEIEVTDAGAGSGALETRPVFAYRDALPRAMRLFTGLWQQPAFYRFLVFLTLVVGVRLIFYHMYYTFPKYGIRELGAGAPIGQLFGVLNAAMIIALVPVVGALTQGISAYRMVSFGSLVAALSVFFIAVPPAIFEPLATSRVGDLIVHTWLGIPGIVDPRYVGIFLFVCFLSLGEALWSPKLYEYTAAIAPQGQEASYMSLSFLPFFIAKFFVGMLSGFLLGNYCPETGPRDCETLWLLVGLMALITPLGLFALRRYLQGDEPERVGIRPAA